jgi:hypothetical protein
MKITNNTALPQPFVDAVTPRRPRADVIRVTELIAPPLIRQLMLNHWDDLEDDAANRVWAVFGQSVHSLLEAATKDGSHLVEMELIYDPPFGTLQLRGRPDLMTWKNATLTDYKVTSVWSVVFDDKVEWSQQLNTYAFMLSEQGIRVDAIQNVCILRDWSRREASLKPDYPQSPVVTVPQTLWATAEQEKFIHDRLITHLEETCPCSPQERWAKPTTFAVKKPGAKRATRVLDSMEAAGQFLVDNPSLKGATVEVRPGESTRCLHYCPVAAVCPHRAQFAAAATEEQPEC